MPYRQPTERVTRMRLAAATEIGRLRSVNEDGFVVAHGAGVAWPPEARLDLGLLEPLLLGVLDGTGSEEAWSIAARGAVGASPSGLPAVVRTAHEALWARARELGGAGATATFVSFEEERWQWAQVGDTRAYRLREGSFEKLTPEHSLVEELLKSGQLTPEEARDFPLRNVITRAIGVTEKVEPDFGSFEVERGDRLLLCSDGLWGELDDRTIARLLHDHPEPEEACWTLLDAANRAGGRDNITALVANVG